MLKSIQTILKQDKETMALRPEIGWLVREDPTMDFDTNDVLNKAQQAKAMGDDDVVIIDGIEIACAKMLHKLHFNLVGHSDNGIRQVFLQKRPCRPAFAPEAKNKDALTAQAIQNQFKHSIFLLIFPQTSQVRNAHR